VSKKLTSRYLTSHIKEDLEKKMVFLGGPRQVGKTTLAQSLIRGFHDGHKAYINWDSDLDRRRFRERDWPKKESLIVLDEIHKMKNWRNSVKGLFDTLKNSHQFLVTGSARLDHFRNGGDSLLGRYHYYRLHPFSLPEIGFTEENLRALFKFGGFPEPLFEKDERVLRRWHLTRLSRLVRTDLNSLETVKDIDKVELLAEELPRRVGSPLSHKSISEDLDVDPKTVKRWIGILDSLYYSFQIAPFGSPKIRAVKKEQKLYLLDWSQVEDPGARFENMVASHLLKFCHFHQDVQGHKMELRYIRDTDKREVDFVVLKDKKPLFAVEAKLAEKSVSPHIFYFQDRLSIPKYYQVTLKEEERSLKDGIILTNLEGLCRSEALI
jgi:predicted AAA+ superfamily ATPase